MKNEGSSSANPAERQRWREIFAGVGISPSKARGQNFLHDRKIVERIVDAAGVTTNDVVLEIGPGLGVMTRELARRARKVVAIEIDHALAEHLRATLPCSVELIEGDALQVDFSEAVGTDYIVVANLPYSVATAIIRRLQESDPPPRALTVMVQREVAERMCARPPDMSLLAVGVQFHGSAKVLFRVGGGAFVPPPRVESAVVQITAHPPPLPREEWASFFRVVAAGFARRRKQLLHVLSVELRLPRDTVARALATAGVTTQSRAETLGVADWLRVYAALCETQELT